MVIVFVPLKTMVCNAPNISHKLSLPFDLITNVAPTLYKVFLYQVVELKYNTYTRWTTYSVGLPTLYINSF